MSDGSAAAGALAQTTGEEYDSGVGQGARPVQEEPAAGRAAEEDRRRRLEDDQAEQRREWGREWGKVASEHAKRRKGAE